MSDPAATPAPLQFLADALGRLPAAGGVRIVTIPAPVASPEELLDTDRPGFFWNTPGAPIHVGLGAAVTLTGTGTDRFREIRNAADELWERIEAVEHPDSPAPPPRVFGGFAFLPGPASPPWEDFGDGTFVLPRLLYTLDGERARLSVAITGGELDADGPDAVLAEAAELLGQLAESGSGSGAEGSGAEESGAGGPRAGSVAPESGRPEPAPGSSTAAGGDSAQKDAAAAREEWSRAVASIHRRMEEGVADKIVAARCRTVPVPGADVPAILRRLDLESSTAARFAFRPGRGVFLGATPERLVTRAGLEVRTEALAGSVAADTPEREARLLESLKDEAEHGYVVQAIVDALGPLCERLDYPAEPRVQRLRHVLHLQTRFVGRLRHGVHVLELVERLHPTPAVGGLPTDEALAWIEREEPGTRGWYAAPVGWFDATGDGEFGVALRSGLLEGGRAHLYAGAGIVRDSDAAAEFDETEVKLRTMLDALGALR